MAFIPMNSGSGGGLTETTLWTNPSPTSAMAAGTALTLSDDYTNYDFLKIKFRMSTTDATEWDVVASKDSVTTAIASTTYSNRISLGATGSSSVAVRLVSRDNSTTTTGLGITNARSWGATGQSTTSIIPTKIIGLKYE